jgi:subtilase family serine protease
VSEVNPPQFCGALKGKQMLTKFGLCAFAAAAGALALGFAAQAQAAVSQITGPINDKQLVTLFNNTRPEARIAANDRGALGAGVPVHGLELLLRRPAVQEKAFESAIADLQNPKSANYHHWMTLSEIGRKYGPSTADVAKITGWLSSHGLHVDAVNPDNMLITFSGNIGQVESAFHTEIHKLSVKGVSHNANMSDPRIPAALASAVAGVVSLHDFEPHSNAVKKGPHLEKKKNGTTGTGTSTVFYLMPEDVATIYNLTPLFHAGITGKGQTVVVLEDTNVYKQADWNVFRAIGGISGYKDATFTQVQPSGAASCANPGTTGDEGEAAIDVDWASASAPDANIELASCKDVGSAVLTFGTFEALQNIIGEANPPKIISMSYGECEAENGATANSGINTLMEDAAAEGITVFVSSGDEDATSCDIIGLFKSGSSYYYDAISGIGISGWASSPYDVAVGGTDFGTLASLCTGAGSYPSCMSPYWNASNDHVYGSAKSYMPEIPWNDSCASQITATYAGYATTYGSTGYCNNATIINGANDDPYLINAGGSGGPSNCASGTSADGYHSNGTCAGWAKPAYQSVLGNPTDKVRDIPDVSLFASNGWWGTYYVVCDSDPTEGSPTGCSGANPGNWAGYGGTSVSSPLMAGIQALINQKTGSAWGQANTEYYALARTEYGASGNAACSSSKGNQVASSCVFYDVTTGDMDAPCGYSIKTNSSGSTLGAIGAVNSGLTSANCYKPSGTVGVTSTSTSSYQPGYGTNVGWDFSTGIGTVNATNLVNAFAAAGFTPPAAAGKSK